MLSCTREEADLCFPIEDKDFENITSSEKRLDYNMQKNILFCKLTDERLSTEKIKGDKTLELNNKNLSK